ncbi:MAG: sirohydrochlorin cobaltochelatase [Lachnospiraceae bacterium]|nr:sirohydrochlorin cobaltochelatase [Lachnospiraceae bacterium]
MRRMRVLFAGIGLAAVMATGCGGSAKEANAAEEGTAAQEKAMEMEAPAGGASETEAPETEEDDEESYNTGDASLDKVRNQDGIGEKELLVVSFGTSYNDSRRLTIGAVEAALETAFPEFSVRRGFTSQIIIDHIKKRDQVTIDNVGEALDRAVANGVKTLVIQPTHLMNGLEYRDLVNEAAKHSEAFERIAMGKPLLTTEEDFAAVAKAITAATAEYDDGETAICFMGHGTEADSNAVYEKLQTVLKESGFAHYYVGTVEAEPTLEDILAMVEAGGYKRVVLQPLMVVAGDHANQDMAGAGEGSWKSVFESAGYEVECVLCGLGELEDIQALFVEHARQAVESLKQ